MLGSVKFRSNPYHLKVTRTAQPTTFQKQRVPARSSKGPRTLPIRMLLLLAAAGAFPGCAAERMPKPRFPPGQTLHPPLIAARDVWIPEDVVGLGRSHALHEAVLRGDIIKVHDLLSKGYRVNQGATVYFRDESRAFNVTPLRLARIFSAPAFEEVLRDAGAGLEPDLRVPFLVDDIRRIYGGTHLHFAVLFKNLNGVRILVEDKDFSPNEGAQIILKATAPSQLKVFTGVTPLDIARSLPTTVIEDYLVAQGATGRF